MALRLLSILAALVLALTVVTTKELIAWATDLLCPSQADDLLKAGQILQQLLGRGRNGSSRCSPSAGLCAMVLRRP